MLIRTMGYLLRFILLLNVIYSSFAMNVKFLPSTSFNSPSSFRDGKLPCSKETVVFPETLMTYVKLESDISVAGFILPRDGEIVFDDGTVEFGANEDDVNCTDHGNVYYMEKFAVKWSSPDIWSSPTFNDATPDAERIPCINDVVEFPANVQFSVTLPDQTQSIAGVKLYNQTYDTSDNFKSMIEKYEISEQFINNRFADTGLKFEHKPCQSRAGCQCQKHPLKIDCETKFCPVAKCVDPIKPEGHCCKICGGVIAFDIDETFDMMVFRELVEQIIESYGIDDLLWHIGRLPQNKVQLVVVDKAEYSGTSAEVINDIDHQMKRHWVQGATFVEISGSPLYKSGLGGKLFISMFFLVVLVMGGIYFYYYKLPEMSDFRFSTLQRSTPGVFSRFQSRTDSVVCLTRRDSERSVGASFKNPLYDTLGQRVEVEEVSGED